MRISKNEICDAGIQNYTYECPHCHKFLSIDREFKDWSITLCPHCNKNTKPLKEKWISATVLFGSLKPLDRFEYDDELYKVIIEEMRHSRNFVAYRESDGVIVGFSPNVEVIPIFGFM